MRGIWLACALLGVSASFVSAQTVTNPTTAVFTASADHAKVLADGTHAVTDYGIAITLSGASAPVTTLSVVQQNGGVMPTPDATNTITLVIPNAFKALGFGTYTAAADAIGPGGTSAMSAPSNPFNSVPAPAGAGKPTVK